MRHSQWLVMFFIGILLPFTISADTTDDTHRIRVSLNNGSRLVGTTRLNAFDVDLGFKVLEIPIQRVLRVDRILGVQGASHRILFRNGDVLTGRLRNKLIELDATFDTLSLSVGLVSKLEVLEFSSEMPIQDGLLLHLPFDCDNDSEILDHSSVDHDIHSDSIKFNSVNLRGRVAVFKGRSQIKVAHSEALCPRNLTIGGWMYPTKTAQSYQVIAAKTNPSSWNGGYGLYNYPDNTIYFFVNGYHSTYVQAKLPLNRWSHVIGICEDRCIRIYINGEMVQQTSINQVATEESRERSFNGGVTHHVDTPLYLGADSNHNSWDGLLDDFVLFNRALNDYEVRSLYRVGSGAAHTPMDRELSDAEAAHENAGAHEPASGRHSKSLLSPPSISEF